MEFIGISWTSLEPNPVDVGTFVVAESLLVYVTQRLEPNPVVIRGSSWTRSTDINQSRINKSCGYWGF